MFEGQLTQCLAYGKCLINDNSYKDGDDKEREGIIKNYGDNISSLIISLHLKKKKTAICPQDYKKQKTWHCYFLEGDTLLESPETILKHNSLNLLVHKII